MVLDRIGSPSEMRVWCVSSTGFSPVKARVRKGAKRFQDPNFSQTALLDFLGFAISVHKRSSAVGLLISFYQCL
jgi:hypothetical protein